MKRPRPPRPRLLAVREIRARFLDRGFPRLEMSLLLAAAGGAAFLTSFALLHSGVASMAVRYGAAALAGYVTLLALFRLWLWAAVRRIASRSSVARDVAEAVVDGLGDLPLPSGSGSPPGFGGGGGFSGGGGGASFGDDVPVVAPLQSSAGGGSGSKGGFDLGFDLDFDEGWVVVIPIIAAGAVLVAAFTVVSGAPVLLAELLLDGLVAAGIYRRLRHGERQHWLAGAVRRTWLAALGVIAVATAAGFLVQLVAPTARSIGDLWR